MRTNFLEGPIHGDKDNHDVVLLFTIAGIVMRQEAKQSRDDLCSIRHKRIEPWGSMINFFCVCAEFIS